MKENSFAQWLQGVRDSSEIKKGWVKQFAHFLGVSTNCVYEWLDGTTEPTHVPSMKLYIEKRWLQKEQEEGFPMGDLAELHPARLTVVPQRDPTEVLENCVRMLAEIAKRGRFTALRGVEDLLRALSQPRREPARRRKTA